MSLIRPKIEEDPSIKMIIPTNNTNTTGRWLMEITKKYEKQAKAHVENTLMALDENLLEKLECDGFEVMPKISLTSWGETDISDLVNNTTIKHPDKVQDNPKPNECLRSPRMTRSTPTDTFEKSHQILP